ncbi:MAG TPA: hypothetical protein VKG61_09865 [Streptosporangiaceae bacterium]|nr:hypothetical protein [Streptosporangiaceae bacterium]
MREAGLVEVQEAQRRVYSLRPQPLAEIDEWLAGTGPYGSSGWMPRTPR